MASPSRPQGQIKRVPVPVRPSAPAPISTTATASPVAIQTTLSSTLPSTQAPFVVRDQYRPRGPVPIVETNSHQSIPPHPTHNHGHNHGPQHPSPYTLHSIRMDPESQNSRYTLPPHVEDDIKAAVLASMPLNDHSGPMRKRKTAVHRKGLRWASISFCIILILGEIVTSIFFATDPPAYFAWSLGALIAFWNGFRLFRMRQRFNNEIISGWHFGLEATAVSALLAVAVTVAAWTTGGLGGWAQWWRGITVAIILFICFILHFAILVLTAVEKWIKPASADSAYTHMSLPNDAQSQQAPRIIVQYTPTCPVCHGHGPRQGEDENSYLASIGDSQPQGVAPAKLMQHKEAMYTDETLNENVYYGGRR
ncbi:hypothetical protein F5Y03DRAFT_365955 [Xylaria venustula]|nr:hypothetical protein F5Y03DRAFT_365955 [Xylaria venustula]